MILKKVSIYRQVKQLSKAEIAATDILSTEIKKRTGIHCTITSKWPVDGDVIILKSNLAGIQLPVAFDNLLTLPQKPESFRVLMSRRANRVMILIDGHDGRGVLFGAGKLLRLMEYGKGSITLPENISIAESPDKPIRGHQLGYRNTANSYDGWTVLQFDQYIRDLVIFGTNSIETIPIFDQKASPHFTLPPAKMNAKLSQVCKRYDLDFWMWIPAQFDLKDLDKRNKYLDTLGKTFHNAVRVDGLFFPGGDPGDNPPELVIPLLEEISILVKKNHPEASVWLSLQGYNQQQTQFVYTYIREKMPSWLGGLITGPSSPPVAETRAALPGKYKLRYYPDLTHNVRCEFPVRWWDPAFNFTLGREAVNPRPYQFGAIYRALEQYTDGFISYSDGAHDDVNKIVWTRLAWNPALNEREIVKEYTNYFFGSPVAEDAADAILALEKNWEGPVESNGSIQSTVKAWEILEERHPELSNNWRWQLCLLRAYYDAYTRKRSIYEASLETEANEALLDCKSSGVHKAIQNATRILAMAETRPVAASWRKKIVDLCASLYKLISLQTSVTKYGASGSERGAILDFIDRPLNNRWWIEDECKRIKLLPEKEQVNALEVIARWENPVEGSLYDDVGNVSKSPRVIRGEGWVTDPLMLKGDNQGFDWWESGFSRKRLSWMTNLRWPVAVEYNGLDSTAEYKVRITGFGESLLRANGQRVSPTLYGKGIGEWKEFPIPKQLTNRGKLVLTWDEINEDHINWRQQSRVTEVWLIKIGSK